MSNRNRTTITTTQRLQLNLSLAASIRILAQDATGLTMYLEEQAAANPHLRLTPAGAQPVDWLPRWRGAFRQDEGRALAQAAGPSLVAHVLAEVDRKFTRPDERAVAVLFAQALEPSGWLGRPIDAIAVEAGVDAGLAESVLRRLQDTEPAGLFARNLSECLALQLTEAGWLDAPMAVILARLDLLAAGDTARLARLAGTDAAGVALRLRRIRGMNPKPGTLFEHGAAPVREPDLLVTSEAGGWVVALNRSALPALSIEPKAVGGSPEKLAEARDLAHMVEARGATLLRIGQEVLRRQAATLEFGRAALQPMTMGDVAGALGLHVSTVSRAVAGASVDTPNGTFWLRHFFTQGLRHRSSTAPDAGTGPSAGALRAELARVIAAEDPAFPLSDADLALALAQAFGPPAPARRTVAKYRDLLSIPPASRRRRKG